MIETLKQKVLSGQLLNKEEAILLIQETNKDELYKAAHEITRHFMDNKFDTCSIINAKSGNCSEDCKWCAQSGHYKTKVNLYPLLSEEECVKHAHYNNEHEIGRFALVTSGKRVSDKDMERIAQIVRAIKKDSKIKCCASMGLLTHEELKTLRESGVENYHCNIESSPNYFKKLCSTHTTEQKLATLRDARSLGFRICSGGIIGMGETIEDRIDMALLLQKEEILSIPINLLQPIPGTPLENTPQLSQEDILTTIAIFRFINPKSYLRFSGGRMLITKETQQMALYIGVNAAIIGDLLTTVGSKIKEDKEMFVEAGYSLTENTDWEK